MNKAKWVIGLMALLVVPAYAGQKGGTPLTLDTQNRMAWGDVNTVRSAPDPLSSIGCTIHSFSSGPAQVVCVAINATGTLGYCISSNPSIVQAALAAGPSSFYQFQWDSTGTCTILIIGNGSSWGLIQP